MSGEDTSSPYAHSGWLLLLSAIALAISACATPEVSPARPANGGAVGEPASDVAATDTLRPDWASAFEAEGAIGTFVLYDPATGQTQRHNPERASTRFTPASTSKVFNALVFLDQGVVSDPDSMLEWDGIERSIPAWNQDHSLRSGVEVSAVWLFQRLALEVGRAGYDDVFARQPYGNSTMGEPLEMAWLDGSLRISADEQIAFIDGLRRGELAFSEEDQATVRDLMPVLAEGDGWRLLGKTGWGGYDSPTGERISIGWIVGWVERPVGDMVYAMNAEAAPGETFDIGRGRLRIVRAVLEAEGVISPDDSADSR